MRLTDAVVRRSKPQDKPYTLWDGRGLYLLVRASGGKWWRLSYRLGGRKRIISLGVYPAVSLEKARQKLQAARELIADGRDPLQAKREAARQVKARDAFSLVARQWFLKQHNYAPATKKKVTWFLDALILPALGSRPIGQIEPPDVLALLEAIERRGTHETAHRARVICGQILRYAVATGRATRDATRDLKGALAPVVTTSHAAITDPAQVGGLLRAIDSFRGSFVVSAALRLLPLVFVRPGELRHAEWTEIDLDRAVWRLPARKMKMRDDHLVPLSAQAIAILRDLAPLTSAGRYVFPSARTGQRPMSDLAINAALRRLGYTADEMTAHGFRALARTLLDEQLRIAPDVIEVQLAHVVRGPLGATYNRSAYWEQRVTLMQRWADYLDGLRTLPAPPPAPR